MFKNYVYTDWSIHNVWHVLYSYGNVLDKKYRRNGYLIVVRNAGISCNNYIDVLFFLNTFLFILWYHLQFSLNLLLIFWSPLIFLIKVKLLLIILVVPTAGEALFLMQMMSKFWIVWVQCLLLYCGEHSKFTNHGFSFRTPNE